LLADADEDNIALIALYCFERLDEQQFVRRIAKELLTVRLLPVRKAASRRTEVLRYWNRSAR